MASNQPDDISHLLPPENATPGQYGLRQDGISFFERMAIKNLFDTQPKRRAAYLKKIGFQEDPRDSNKLRPLGSPDNAPYTIEVDPGAGDIFNISQYWKNGLIAGAGEAAQDITDVIGDIGKGAVVGGSAAFGAGLGGAAGGPLLGTMGAVLGGGLGAYASEEAKKTLGDALIDPRIPNDQAVQVTDALINGVAGPLLSKAGSVAKGYLGGKLVKAKDAVVRAIQSSGSSVDESIINRAARNIEDYTPEKVKRGVAESNHLVKQLFGLDTSDPTVRINQIKDVSQIPDSSIFKQQIAGVLKQKDEALAKLAADPRAAIPGDELAKRYQAFISYATSGKPLTEEQKDALPVVRTLYKEILDAGAHRLGIKPDEMFASDLKKVQFPYDEADLFLKNLQKNVFVTKPNQVVGSDNPILGTIAHDSNVDLESVATALKSPYPDLKDKTQQFVKTYNIAKQEIRPDKIYAAYKGGSNDAQFELKNFVNEAIDKPLGTNYNQYFEENTAKRWMNDLYENKGTMSRTEQEARIKAAQLAGAIKGGTRGLAVGAPLTAGLAALGTGPISAIPTAVTAAGGAGLGYLQGGAEAAIQNDIPAAMQQYAAIQAKLAQPQIPGLSQSVINAATSPVSRSAGQAGIPIASTIAPIVAPLVRSKQEPDDDISHLLPQ